MDETTAAPVEPERPAIANRGRAPIAMVVIGAVLAVVGVFMAFQFSQSLGALQALTSEPADVLYAATGLTSYTLQDQITAATFLVWASLAAGAGGVALLVVGGAKLARRPQ